MSRFEHTDDGFCPQGRPRPDAEILCRIDAATLARDRDPVGQGPAFAGTESAKCADGYWKCRLGLSELHFDHIT